ncbi:MAG: hypothetical protein EBY25_08740, partial [Betaproteobacteria bacterium]|nr:hypothetical protein [Betaproteobacteria bacterium]
SCAIAAAGAKAGFDVAAIYTAKTLVSTPLRVLKHLKILAMSTFAHYLRLSGRTVLITGRLGRG